MSKTRLPDIRTLTQTTSPVKSLDDVSFIKSVISNLNDMRQKKCFWFKMKFMSTHPCSIIMGFYLEKLLVTEIKWFWLYLIIKEQQKQPNNWNTSVIQPTYIAYWSDIKKLQEVTKNQLVKLPKLSNLVVYFQAIESRKVSFCFKCLMRPLFLH